jgi:hypothetical protein
MSFLELLQKNKYELLNNNKEIERIEKHIDQRHANYISKNNMDLIKLLK